MSETLIEKAATFYLGGISTINSNMDEMRQIDTDTKKGQEQLLYAHGMITGLFACLEQFHKSFYAVLEQHEDARFSLESFEKGVEEWMSAAPVKMRKIK